MQSLLLNKEQLPELSAAACFSQHQQALENDLLRHVLASVRGTIKENSRCLPNMIRNNIIYCLQAVVMIVEGKKSEKQFCCQQYKMRQA